MYSEKTIKSKSQVSKAPMFEKRTVVELSENEMTNVEGGSSPYCIFGAGVAVGIGIAWLLK